MKKSTIWTIAVIMGFSFLGLLYMQISYIEEIAKMKKEQFDESVKRSLYQASRNLEMNETLRYLEKDVNDVERRAFSQDSIIVNGLDGSIQHAHHFSVSAEDGTFYSEFELKTFTTKPANVPKKYILCYFLGTISENVRAQVEQWAVRYNLEVVYLNKNEINNSSTEAGPQEFIYYFANAELVCTDSFHGTVFSIIFLNPFVVFERRDSKEKSNEQMGSRFKTLLQKFNLENRLYESITEENIFELKTDYFQKIMLEEKLKAESFLKNAFST